MPAARPLLFLGWTATIERALQSRLGRLAMSAAVVAGGLLVGLVVAIGTDRFGPLVAIAPPLAALAAAAVFQRPVLAIGLVAAALPVGTRVVPTHIISLQVVEVAVLFAAGVVTLQRLVGGAVWLRWHPALAWVIALLILAVVDTPGAEDLGAAIRQDAAIAGGILLVLVVVSVCPTPRELRWAAGAVVAAGGFICALALPHASALQAQAGALRVESRAVSIFNQPNFLGAFAAAVLFVGIGLTLAARTWWSRTGAALAVIAAAGGLLLSLSRGAWIGTGVGIAAMAVFLPSFRRQVLIAGALVLGALAVVGAVQPSNPELVVVQQRVSTLTANEQRSPYDSRPAIWHEAVREIRAHPWTGVGPANFVNASARSTSEAETIGAEHAHNVMLTVGAEAGLPAVGALVAFTIAVAIAARRGARRAGPADRPLVAGIAAGLSTAIGHGLVDHTLRNAVVVYLMWLLVGLVLAAAPTDAGGLERQPETASIPLRSGSSDR